jgi:choline kinase
MPASRRAGGGCGPVNRVLIDRDFEPGDEPVKVCVQAGVPIELRKQAGRRPEIRHHRRVGWIFPLRRSGRPPSGDRGGRLRGARRRANMPHEEAVRDLILERSQVIEVSDVTGAPWIEIDFPNDVVRAARTRCCRNFSR